MQDKTKDISRRRALTRLGALALGAYTVPAFTTLSAAHASGGSSGSSGSSSSSSSSNASSSSTPSESSTPSTCSSATDDVNCQPAN